MKKVSSILGLPRRQTIIEVFNILVKYRFLVLVYFAILIIYFIVFFKFKTPADVDNFKISLSASILEDLAMFIFLTVGVTFVSIKLSSISPEDHEFDRRIKALMNSQHVTNDRNVYNFLYNSISKMLNYNKEMIYSVCVLDYHISADTKIFR